MNNRRLMTVAALLALAGCARGENANQPENGNDAVNFSRNAAADEPEAMVDPADNVTSAPLPTDAWVGKWIGVEGLVLAIQPAGEKGHYMLSVTLLDGTNSYDGTADGNVIRFTRDDKPESVRAATGAETGLKWLADKQNCLMIKSGEGFCREP